MKKRKDGYSPYLESLVMRMDKTVRDIIDGKVNWRHIKVVGSNKKREFDSRPRPQALWQMRHIPYQTDRSDKKDEDKEDVL